MDETHPAQSNERRPIHWVKARILDFIAGLMITSLVEKLLVEKLTATDA